MVKDNSLITILGKQEVIGSNDSNIDSSTEIPALKSPDSKKKKKKKSVFTHWIEQRSPKGSI